MTQREIFKMFACPDCLENGVSTDCECWESQSWSKICPSCKSVTYESNSFTGTVCDNCGEALFLSDEAEREARLQLTDY